MDTVDEEEYTLVGVFIGDLYQVGTYNTRTKQFTIDRQEVDDSISLILSPP
jgi:hypothetical protein